MSYIKTAVTGVGWIGAFRGFSRVVAYVKLAILARLLLPEEFGVYGIALLVLSFLEIFTETGINTVLIQERKNINRFIDTAWIISIFRGFLIFSLIILTAPFVARFFNSPKSLNLLYLISLIPLIRGFINPSVVKLQKNLHFKKEFIYRLTLFTLDALIAVIVVLVTGNVAGIIWGNVIGVFIEMVWSYFIVSPRPHFSFNKKIAQKIVSQGKWVTGSRIFQYLFSQGDDVFVGRLLGETSLGLYQAAYKLSTLPVSEIADVVGKVTFPLYVKMADDKERLKHAFKRVFTVSTSLIIIMGVLIYMCATPLVRIILGDNWLTVIPTLQILAFFGITKGISTSCHSLFLATGNQRYVTHTTFFSTVILAVCLYPLLEAFGIRGAAYAAFIGSFASLPLAFYYTIRTIHE